MKKKILLDMIMSLEKRVEELERVGAKPIIDFGRPFIPPPSYTLKGKTLTIKPGGTDVIRD